MNRLHCQNVDYKSGVPLSAAWHQRKVTVIGNNTTTTNQKTVVLIVQLIK